ncbi:MAG: serine hydrolase [Betaproteobacteria bacterium]|nr:serine hydrolase [Betaproteobacteria bacterium]
MPTPAPTHVPEELALSIAHLINDRFPANAPGVAVGVLRDGERFTHCRGLARLPSADVTAPFTPHTRFRACSITKQFVALLLLQLDAEGRLSLDDTPGKWVPALAGFDPALRLKHLAQNRSGLVDYWCAAMLTGAKPESRFTREDGEKLIASLPRQMFAPGHGNRYNNGNWRILEWVLQAASGHTLADLLRMRIFAPLEMHASTLGEDTSLPLADGATGYRDVDGRWEEEVTRIWWSGDAALVTTLDDLMKWEAAWLRRDPVLTAALERLPQALAHADGRPASYAFGMNAWTAKGRRMHWHGGALRGFRMAQFRFPDEHASVLVMMNRTANPVPLALEVAALLSLPPAWDSPAPADAEVVRLPDPTGAWAADDIGLVATFGIRADQPTLSLGMDPATLLGTGVDTWASTDGFIDVSHAGDALRITARHFGWSERFTRVAPGDARPELADTVWASSELGSRISFSANGATLQITGPHGQSERYPVIPIGADRVAFDCLRALDEQPPGRFHLRRAGNVLVVGCLLATGFEFQRLPR